jgi:TRAP-type mannitol/chloroaromatic compound transport system permease small subunit
VRVDIFYRSFSERQKAWVNILGHVIFTLPVCVLIGWGSLDYVLDSWSAREASPEPGGLAYVFLLKTLIPVMASLLALQSLAQCQRALSSLRRGSAS